MLGLHQDSCRTIENQQNMGNVAKSLPGTLATMLESQQDSVTNFSCLKLYQGQQVLTYSFSVCKRVKTLSSFCSSVLKTSACFTECSSWNTQSAWQLPGQFEQGGSSSVSQYIQQRIFIDHFSTLCFMSESVSKHHSVTLRILSALGSTDSGCCTL